MTRRLLRSAVLWGTVLVGAGVAWNVITRDLPLGSYLLLLVGGWCFGFAFVNLTMRMPRWGFLLHLTVSVAAGAAMIFLVENLGAVVEPLTETVAGVVLTVQLAAIPAVGWTWLGMIGRVTDAIGRRDRARTPARVTPEWEREESGDGSGIEFRGVELRRAQYTRAIVAVTAVAGVGAIAVLILFDDAVMRLGARLSIVLVGLLLGLPAYAVVTAAVRRRTLDCAVAFGNDELRIRVGAAASVIRYTELDYLLWRSRSEYARIEARGGGVDISVFSGVAKPLVGRTAELPELPRRVFRRLELCGLAVERSRRGDVVAFRRAVS